MFQWSRERAKHEIERERERARERQRMREGRRLQYIEGRERTAHHACWLLFLIIVKHKSASFISAGWGGGLWQRGKKNKRLYNFHLNLFKCEARGLRTYCYAYKTNTHPCKTLAHTCMHKHSKKSTSAQLNSFPDVHAVDREDWRGGGGRSIFWKTHTRINPLFGTRFIINPNSWSAAVSNWRAEQTNIMHSNHFKLKKNISKWAAFLTGLL